MNGDKSNKQEDKKTNILQEPKAVYESEDNSALNNSENMDPILEKLILKGIQDAKDGKGISHEEMMQKVKLKYPFLK